ncbi:aminoacyl-tRNA hydrolase [Candidatus Curtissbacteria bacterium RBG_13_40_7]|uniref:Peptidyl-tRNA hydrolase n=1 Tax=Candidatus Curtissbacteria bacterium RBG_13_40_7 TaxID=1797706 RepID=A0A1F5FZ42_9BACT|nr:MAG: aminoacyl-tRNA hydrolase [Candidatus Curtissbacteria bacterium RBG_13_40_7]
MKLIVGLGNPGAKFKNTRHNLGFMVIDNFARAQGFAWRYNQDWMGYFSKSDDFVIAKPSTYMNKSGESIISITNFYKVDKKDILVIHDDLDLAFGKIRLSFDSASAGHRGVESVIDSLGSFDFGRLRIGIGRSPNIDPEKFVLEEFSSDEQGKLEEIVKTSIEAIKSYLNDGIEATMNSFN